MLSPMTRAERLTVQKLLERAARGELRLPRFQRPLKWKLKDNLMLLDSIYRGYPIGTLLLWEKQQAAGRVTLGPVAIDAPESRRAWLIVDGQQRITALVGSMMRTDGELDDYAIGFDLQHEEFTQLRRGGAPTVVPLSELVAPERLLSWLEKSEARQVVADASERAFRASTRIRDYEIAAYVLDTEDEAMVRDVFDRLNTRGKRLTKADVFNAIDQSEGGAQGLKQIQAALADFSFGRLDDSRVLQSVQAVMGEDITQPLRPKWSASLREAIFSRTLAALRQAIVFLRRHGGVPHSALLPYSLPIPILARFFALHPEPQARSLELLRRWLWRGFVHGTHQGQSIPLVRKLVKAVSSVEIESVDALLRLVPDDAAAVALARVVNLKTAHSRMEVLALLRSKPRSFATGEPIDVASVIETIGVNRLLAHLVPSESSEDGKTIANRVVTDGVGPPDDLTVLSEQTLDSQALDPTDDLHDMVSRRYDHLLNHVPDSFNALMGWRQSDRPSLQSLFDPEQALE